MLLGIDRYCGIIDICIVLIFINFMDFFIDVFKFKINNEKYK